MSTLDELIGRFEKMPAEDIAETLKEADRIIGVQSWIPNPGPQTDAYFCLADLLLYGGQGGGGKSDLLLGLAATTHRRSLLMRRQYTDLGALLERAVEIAPDASVNRSPPPKVRFANGRLLEFGAAKTLGDEQSWQGQPHDLLAFDEAVQFLEAQIRFLLGWVRTTEEGQRCRTILATNPPVTAEGNWIVGMFRPWLDITYSKPAKPGELRWFVTDPDGKDVEVDGPNPVEMSTMTLIPRSRTFIPAALGDNPFLVNTGYQSTLDSLPEPLRSAIRDGNFMAARKDDAFQIIPTSWVIAAQLRWTQRPPSGVPMCAMGCDMSGGGDDPMIIAPRHDGWFAPVIEIPGSLLSMDRIGAMCAGHIMMNRRDKATIVMDMGGGYGSATYEHMRSNGEDDIVAYKGAEASLQRTYDRKMGFTNKRTEVLWKFREALDPGQPGGSPIMLPDDPLLIADLTAPLFTSTTRGLQAEAKVDVVKRLGRSPDRGDAVVMAWSAGLKQLHVEGGFVQRDQRVGSRRSKAPNVIVHKRR